MQIWGFQQLAFGFSVKENNHKYGLNSKISPRVFFQIPKIKVENNINTKWLNYFRNLKQSQVVFRMGVLRTVLPNTQIA